MTDEQRQRIVSQLNGRSQVDAFEAAKAVWEDSDERLERPLILTLKKGADRLIVLPQPSQCRW
jgi:hypothetical protein